MGVVLVFSYDS